jgi:hypothetical protein
MKNEYSKVIPQEVLDKVNAKLQECYNELKPFGVELPQSKRDELPRLGVRNTGKVSSITTEMNSAPEYAPPMFSLVEVNKDFKVITDLEPIASKIASLGMLVDDTLIVAGSEALEGCMDYYCSVKRFAVKDDPKAQAIFDRLSPMFSHKTVAKKPSK